MTAVAASFCATLVDELVRCGVTHAVVCPGSRSTPLALALARDGRLQVEVHHDERVAAFIALGVGAATGRPAVVLTTSGTAAVELHPAVVEAAHNRVPLIACTADRPPELHGVGAPQTIEQTGLFGGVVRWAADPGPPDAATAGTWRSLASRAYVKATGSPPGPVHLNLAFREPLLGDPGELPAGREAGLPWHEGLVTERHLDHASLRRLAEHCRGLRGVLVAGAGISRPEAVLVLAHTLGWPVLADPRSGCRIPDRAVVAHFDALLRDGDQLQPQVVLRLGMPPASKALASWLARSDALQVVIDAHGGWFDPDHDAGMVAAADPAWVCLELAAQLEGEVVDREWSRLWQDLDRVAAEAIEASLGDGLSEPAIARDVAAALPEGATMVVSSSMPVRDVEWYAAPRDGLRVLANRGANGIDGVVSTAVGVALGAGPTAALVGDLAFLHDANALLGLATRPVDLVVIVVHNDGGGIFSFLPQARSLPQPVFERLFGTPHGVDPCSLAAVHGLPAVQVEDRAGLRDAIRDRLAAGGPHVVVAGTDRAANVAVHDGLHAAIRAARSR
ncbi:2-succinyl-5-enolpyruvyl-6-hydroxy-3-cyclohexene-1-carboxylic-acid synthase [Rhabdothermincola sediminis]|uniref:2-succinyl-5-enolpyruvyl-6-hydroxy-3- cyclohexene-1-carboxylic-acid synthase n=1 Tax=Rhabdothermincola sediminis TaxID=2751370 RepID=UPI001AA0595C|nr:2-succinyl-5-enolpyruvyl-6-hydroxy-3-cyclohexene-1-carboxylic-acid synthase [Rhabdothermincola sediminis]